MDLRSLFPGLFGSFLSCGRFCSAGNFLAGGDSIKPLGVLVHGRVVLLLGEKSFRNHHGVESAFLVLGGVRERECERFLVEG